MTRAVFAACALLALAALGSCASLSESACRAGDWEGIGFRDGANGRPETYVANHAEACAEVGVSPDVARWRSGRTEGLALYCTPDNAYALGAAGARLNPVCPAARARDLAVANDRGLRYWRLAQEMARLNAEIQGLDRQVDRLLDDEVDRDARRLIRALRADIARSERTLRLLAAQRALYDGPF